MVGWHRREAERPCLVSGASERNRKTFKMSLVPREEKELVYKNKL